MESSTLGMQERPSGLWAPTATGLYPDAIKALSDSDLKTLGLWHAEMAGDSPGRPFWPAAIRKLSLQTRLLLATDAEGAAVWKERERRRVRESVPYFVESYGHVQPEVGPPLPFLLWEEQHDVLQIMLENLRLIILKARQLGLTWLALHHAFHMLAFDPTTPVAKILALSKHGGEATKLLQRARRINELLPPFLRVSEERETEKSLSKFSLEDRGEMISLAGSPDAARSETASYVLMDEAAFIRNRQAGPTIGAILPTLGKHGRLTIISTGNGPAEGESDGQAFAQYWAMAKAGDPELGLVAIFLPDSVHPERSEDWRRKERKKYLTDEDFLKEHPETEDDAFAMVGGLRVYSPAGINAAEAWGAEYDRMLMEGHEDLPPPEFIFVGADYGEFTHLLLIWPLEGGGVYVAPGEVAPERPQEIGDSTIELHDSARWVQELTERHEDAPSPNGSRVPPLRSIRYDSAGAQSNRTFVKTVESKPNLLRSWTTKRVDARDKIRRTPVAFGKYKDDTKDYLRHLFERSARSRLAVDDEKYVDPVRIIAISPKNKVLLRQLRGLELKDNGTGQIRKGDDHGPDALIAGAAPISIRFHDRGNK